MKRKRYQPYIAAGITAFCVLTAAILLFFLLSRAPLVWKFFGGLVYILRPIFMGAVLAFLLLPIHHAIFRFLTAMTPNHKLDDTRNVGFLNFVAIVFSLIFAAFLIYLLLAMVIPQVYISVVGLVNSSSEYIRTAQRALLAFFEDNPDIQAAVISAYDSAAVKLQQWLNSSILPNLESVSTTIKWIRDTVLPQITGVVTQVSGTLISFFVLLKDLLIAVIVSIYILLRKEVFAAQSKKIVYSIFPTWAADLIVEESREAYRIMSGFINGKLVDSLIIGIITMVCCSIFKFPYPALVSTVIGVTNIIPFFGPFIGAIPCALLILLVSPRQCIYFIIFIFILQQFDGNILGPKILGDSTGLASFWVLFSILLFGGLFGFAGMVLGVPVFAMIYSIIRRLVNCGLRRRGLPDDTAAYLGVTGPMAGTSESGKGELPE